MAAEDFIAELDGWVEWYRSGRAKMSFGWRTMDENRRALGGEGMIFWTPS